MIELNLIPDVKKELLKTQKIRNFVMSIAILCGIGSIVLLGLIAGWVFGAQTLSKNNAEKRIDEQQRTLESRTEPTTLQLVTIQDQLNQIQSLTANKYLASRIFGVVDTIRKAASNPPVSLSTLTFNKATNTINIEGQATGFEALDAFRKAAERTTFTYADASGEPVEDAPLLDGEVVIQEARFGEDADGNRVVRFIASFTISEDVLRFDSFNSQIFSVQAPGAQNVTDSNLQIPSDMFVQRATDEEGQ